MAERSEKKSPLKKSPLRSPGQSLAERTDQLVLDRVLLWGMLAAVFAVVAVVEWVRAVSESPPQPWLYTAVAAAVIGLGVWRVWAIVPLVRRMNRGREGELAVGQMLERMRSKGYEVIHDLPGDGHNVDHVVVGPEGVFAIETKTAWKGRGDRQVHFDGEVITVDGIVPDRDPVAQVKAAAREVQEIVHDRAGLDVSVRPVLLYPGWWTENGWRHEVLVLNAKAFAGTIGDERRRLSPEEIRQIASGLERHVRDGHGT